MNYKLLFIVCLMLQLNVKAQELRRVASKGFQVSPITLSTAQKNGLPDSLRFQVVNVIAGSTAEELKMNIGDILLSINGIEIRQASDFSDKKITTREGDPITVTVKRNGKTLNLKGKSIANPKEKSDSLTIEYSSFDFAGGKIRSIYLLPKTAGKKPAILFIPGYTCASIDNLNETNVYHKLLYGLAKKGYVVMRAEKPGVGDSQGTPNCDEIDFMTEVESFRHALQALKEHPEVDTNNIFIFGHSMGGMEAPFVADGNQVKGIITMGITIKNWHEYLTEMLRVQNPNLGVDYIQHEKDMKLYFMNC